MKKDNRDVKVERRKPTQPQISTSSNRLWTVELINGIRAYGFG